MRLLSAVGGRVRLALAGRRQPEQLVGEAVPGAAQSEQLLLHKDGLAAVRRRLRIGGAAAATLSEPSTKLKF